MSLQFSTPNQSLPSVGEDGEGKVGSTRVATGVESESMYGGQTSVDGPYSIAGVSV